MRKYLCFLPIFLLLSLGLTGCNGGGETAADSFTLNVECESEGIYQIFYTFYLDGGEMGMGGMADLDGGPLGTEPLSITFTSDQLEGGDPAGFSIDFSPYGENDTAEIATTEPVSIDAAYGESYTVRFYGSREEGFAAELVE